MDPFGILFLIILGFILFIILIWIIGSIIENVAKKREAYREQVEKDKDKEELTPLAKQKAKELLAKFDSNPILHEIAKKFAAGVDRCIRQHVLHFSFELRSEKIELTCYSLNERGGRNVMHKDCVFYSDYNVKPLNSILERATFIYLIVRDISNLCKCSISFNLAFSPTIFISDYSFKTTLDTDEEYINNEKFIDWLFHYYVVEKKLKVHAKKTGQEAASIRLIDTSCYVREKIGKNDW